jgi:O-antigen biosynthesis protein
LASRIWRSLRRRGSKDYSRWVARFDSREDQLIHQQLSSFQYRPRITVVVLGNHSQIPQKTMDSVRRQSYPDWELCIADGGPNEALAMATGEYVALLDPGDMLSQDALFHMVAQLQSEPRADLMYSDEDYINEAGRRFSPFFKPDWSPDLILSENYVGHLVMFRRDLALSAGGFRTQFDVSGDHDLLLRMSRQAKLIAHVSRILYHQRTDATLISSSREVVESFVENGATVEEGLHPGRWRIRYPIPKRSRVSILIPTAGKIKALERNLQSLWTKAGYDDFEVVIIDNSKKSDAVEKYVEELLHNDRRIRHFDQRGEPFNYSRLNNKAVATCDSPLLLFLNDDTEGITEGWLTAMVELAVRSEVGAVGAKLLYPNGLIQHAGVTMGLLGICGHSFRGFKGSGRYYYDFPDVIRNVSAVTAACAMIRSEVFRSVGGFDEAAFPIAYNDIDLMLRIGAAGYRIIYTPHALLNHFEAFSKSTSDFHPHPNETLALKTRWREVIARDPFYNPNLTRHNEDWGLRWD